MTAGDDQGHPSQRPLIGWVGVVVVGILTALALVNSPAARVVVLVLGLLVGVLGWLAFHFSEEVIPSRLLGVAAGISLMSLLTVVTVASDDSSVPEGRSAPTERSPSNSDSPSIVAPSTSPTLGPSSTGSPTQGSPKPQQRFPEPLRGEDAPERVVTEGSSVTMFGGRLLMAAPSVYDSWLSLKAQTDFDLCDGNPDVGETAVLAASRFAEIESENAARLWYRIAILEIRRHSVKLRVERLISADRPTSTAYGC